MDFRGHIDDDLRITFDRASTIDEPTVLPAQCPDVHETFVSLHFCDGPLVELQNRVENHRCRRPLLFAPCRNGSAPGHSCVILLSGIFQLCLRTATGFGQNE